MSCCMKSDVPVHGQNYCMGMRVSLSPAKCWSRALSERATTHISSLVTCAEGRASCGCPAQLTSQCKKGVVFADLDCSKKYFPMIALNQRSAFYGYPPEATFPSGWIEARDLADALSIRKQQDAHMQSFPSWTESGPPSPAASPHQPQQLLPRVQQAQSSDMARELFIRQAKRQRNN